MLSELVLKGKDGCVCGCEAFICTLIEWDRRSSMHVSLDLFEHCICKQYILEPR